jgi:hypothetical protein
MLASNLASSAEAAPLPGARTADRTIGQHALEPKMNNKSTEY